MNEVSQLTKSIVCAAILALVGCTPKTVVSENTPILSPSQTATRIMPTSTITPTDRPTEKPTITPTATYPVPLPPTSTPRPHDVPYPTLQSPEMLETILFGGESENCKLPCWHGLRAGVSTSGDVVAVYKSVFHNPEIAEWFDEPYRGLGPRWSTLDFIAWPNISISAIVDPRTDRLEAMVIQLDQVDSLPYSPDTSIAQLLLRLGEPDEWLVDLDATWQGNAISYYSHMSYDGGIFFVHSVDEPLTAIEEDGTATSTLCFTQRLYVRVYLTSADNLENSPLLKNERREANGMHPSIDSGIDPAQILALIRQGQPPCVEITLKDSGF